MANLDFSDMSFNDAQRAFIQLLIIEIVTTPQWADLQTRHTQKEMDALLQSMIVELILSLYNKAHDNGEPTLFDDIISEFQARAKPA